MKIQIKNRYTDKIIIEGEYKDIKECVEQNKANLRRADLRKADLSEADLYGSNLYEANLRGADLREAYLCEAYLYEIKINSNQIKELLNALEIQNNEYTNQKPIHKQYHHRRRI